MIVEHNIHKVLLVHENTDIIEYISYILEKESYIVSVCDNEKDILRMAQQEKPNIIILDTNLQETDGIDICKTLRAYAEFSNSIITFLSICSSEETQLMAFEAGADDFMCKPINPRLFIYKLKALTRRINKNIQT